MAKLHPAIITGSAEPYQKVSFAVITPVRVASTLAERGCHNTVRLAGRRDEPPGWTAAARVLEE